MQDYASFRRRRIPNALPMIRGTPVLIIVLALIGLACCLSAGADLLCFTGTVSQRGEVAVGEVRAGGTALLRFRGADRSDVELRTRLVAQRLQQQALEGLTASAIRVAALKSAVVIMADGALLVMVDPVTANLAGTSRAALAEQWADNLRRVLAPPYLCLDLAGKLTVPLGELRQVRYGGSYSGELTANSDAPDLISVVVDRESRVVVISGMVRGAARITLSVDKISGSFPVECLPWAGTIQHPLIARLTVPVPPEAVMHQAALNAILTSVRAAPGAAVKVKGLSGQSSGWQAAVTIAGSGYLRREETVTVVPTLVSRPQCVPQCVLVSNEPEKVTQPGTLLRQILEAEATCRLLWHHVSAAQMPLTFTVRVANLGDRPAAVYITGSQAGPGRDEIHTGHVAMYHFWRMMLGAIGYIATVPAGTAWEAYRCSASPSRIISGVAELTNLGSQPLLVEMLAGSTASPLPLVAINPEAAHLQKLSDFEYAAVRSAELVHEIGGAWSFLRIGDHTPHADTIQLAGDYGVMYDIAARVENRSPQQARFEIAVTASGGAARGVYLIDGQLVVTGPMRPLREKVLFRGRVAAGATKSIAIRTIPQSGSNYPVTLVLRSSIR